MIYARDGQAVAVATRAAADDKGQDGVYKRQTARDMKTRFLKSRLCSAGPDRCEACGLCEYGKEYARRMKAGEAQ